jgi:predicted transcriptional regulator
MASKRKLKSLTIEKKSEILKEVDSGVEKKTIAEKYEIPSSTLSTIIKNRTPKVHSKIKKPPPAALGWYNLKNPR